MMGLERKKKSRRKKIKRKKEGILLKNHQAIMTLLISLPNTFRKKTRGRWEKKGLYECTLIQGFLTPG